MIRENRTLLRRARKMISDHFDEVCPIIEGLVDPDLADDDTVGGMISDDRIVRRQVREPLDGRVILPIDRI